MGWDGKGIGKDFSFLRMFLSLCVLCCYLSTIHQFVFTWCRRSWDKAAAQLLFVETLKISPNLAQISLRTLVDTLLVFAPRIYQLSLNTRPVNPHTHTDTRRHCTAGLCGHTCAFCSLQRSTRTCCKHVLPQPLPLLHISPYLLSPLAFTSLVVANLHQPDSLAPQTQTPRGGLSTVLPFRVQSELKTWTVFGSE